MSDVKFYQANKKDAHIVTQGAYTMSTTKKGRYLNRTRPYEVKLKKLWKMEKEVGSQTVNYRMGHTLQSMGIQLTTTDWNKPYFGHRTSSVSSESSECTDEGQNSVKSVIVKQQESDMEELKTQTESDITLISECEQEE
jgi:hypothetical protein